MNRAVAGALGVLLVGGAGVFVATRDPTLVLGAGVCDVVIQSPAPDHANAVAVRSGESLTVSITGKTSRCLGATVSFFVSEDGSGEVSKGTATADGTTGAWSKSLALTDAKSSKFFARMTGGGKTTAASRTFVANTGLPKLAISAPLATDFGVLKVTSSQPATGCGSGGNIHVVTGEPGWVADSSCADGGQVPTSFTVTGASGGAVRVTYQGLEVYDSGVSSSPQTFTPTLTLPDLTRGDLVFSATNGTGTTAITDLTRVMTAIPPTITGPDGGACCVFRIVDARAATVDMDYVLPAIPTSIESASVELLWTTSTVVGPNPDGGWAKLPDGGQLALDAGFDLIALTAGTTITGPSNPGRVYDPLFFKAADGTIEHGNGGFSNGGLVMQIPNDCVLYDPSASPQIWTCRDGLQLASGSVRTATFRRLPPMNIYYLWPMTIY